MKSGQNYPELVSNANESKFLAARPADVTSKRH